MTSALLANNCHPESPKDLCIKLMLRNDHPLREGVRGTYVEREHMPSGRKHRYYVYILDSKTRVLYTGVTNNLSVRLTQHRSQGNLGFSARYNCQSLVHFEIFAYINQAIAREKEIKGRVRKKKIGLVEGRNPNWKDLSADFGKDFESLSEEYFRYMDL